MGRRKGFKKAKNPVDALANAGSSDEDDQLENQLEDLLDDEIEKYNATTEKTLLDKAGKGKASKRKHADADSEDEKEVYGLDLSSDDDEDVNDVGGEESADSEDDDNDDDILGEKEYDGVPDSRAWGNKARAYHNTDYVDQDFGGFEGEDAEMAELEETEAKEIQKRLTAELDESDFLGFLPAKSEKSKKEKSTEVFKLDFDSLSDREKRKLIQRQCPEVIHMIDEYKEKIGHAKSLMKQIEEEPVEFLKEFYKTKYHTIMNYCINLSYFLYLRSKQPANSKGHPVLKRILQFRRLLDELNQFDPSKYVDTPKTNMQLAAKPKTKIAKRTKKAIETDVTMEDKMKGSQETALNSLSEEAEPEKRQITYEMKKNKGLTPHRKKEQRNPRVKHKEKFRKAIIRRRGQVRTPRTEVERYGGELTGIKSHLTKSIKLK